MQQLAVCVPPLLQPTLVIKLRTDGPMPPAAAEATPHNDVPRPSEGKRPKAQKHGVHVAASPGPDRFLFSDLPTREVKALIRAALPAGAPVKLVLAVTAKGRWRGWAKITAGDEARAAAAVAALDGAVVKGVSLRASRGLGRRDNVFPFLDRGLRESFELDSTAAYSAMDEHTTALLASFLGCVYAECDPATLSITDACACTGACAVVLARHFRAVDAVELDAGRCDALRANVLLCGANVTVHRGDYNALWEKVRQDIVFLDVPWGGPDYVEAEGSACDALGGVPLVDVVLRLRRRASAVALRLPTKGRFDVDAFAAALVADSAWAGDEGAEERCLPFRITTHLAHLLVVCMPGPRFGLRTLDATMAAAHAWDERWRQDVRPAFYDWEAKRWIRASRWIPAHARRSRPAEGAPAASDV